MTPREKWTDERLDDLSKKVDDGFAETKAEMREGFARVDGDMKGLRAEMNARFDSLSQILIGGAVAIIVALIGLIATLIGVNAF